MSETNDRTLKELFAAIYHDHEKHPGGEIRHDQEKVLNELLNQPPEFKNTVILNSDGLEILTQKEKLLYIHSKAVDARVIVR
jgi:hypothetical protein